MKRIIFFCSMVVLLLTTSCRKEDPIIVGDELKGDGTFQYTGRTYAYKIIGNQTWMMENLAWLPTVSPSSGGSDSSPFYYVYGYEGSSVIAAKATANYKTYGVLYNFEAAKTACPTGWHLPTDEEWFWLYQYLGMPEPIAHQWAFGIIGDGSVGQQMKSTSGWDQNDNADNSSGFTALPGGFRYDLGFINQGISTGFWSATDIDTGNAWGWSLLNNIDGVFHYNHYHREGLSVRCVKNLE